MDNYMVTELSHPKIILNHSISLLACAHGSPPLGQGEGLGVGWYVIDNQRYYSLLQYPTPAPSPQMGELHGAAFVTNLFISKDMECLSYIYNLSKLP